MDKAGRGDLLCSHAAADAVIALQHEHLGALAAKHRRADQRVDTAADDDVIGGLHWGMLFVGRQWGLNAWNCARRALALHGCHTITPVLPSRMIFSRRPNLTYSFETSASARIG